MLLCNEEELDEFRSFHVCIAFVKLYLMFMVIRFKRNFVKESLHAQEISGSFENTMKFCESLSLLPVQ
jgi:hypothetical protein